MQRMLVLAMVVALGCSKGSDSSARRYPDRGGPADLAESAGAAPANPEPLAEPVYQGQPLSHWVEQFNQPEDSTTRANAAQALGQLGEEGFPPLLRAMQGNSDEARVLALQAVTKEMLVEHQAETMPLLRRMLADNNATLRKQAAERLSWYGVKDLPALKENVRLLRELAQNDPQPEVREVANGALRSITSAYTGKPVAGAPDDPKLPF
jgi:hypothetical protein